MLPTGYKGQHQLLQNGKAAGFHAIHLHRRPIHQTIKVKIAVNREQFAYTSDLSNCNKGCICNIHWAFVLHTHQLSHPIGFSRCYFDDVESPIMTNSP